MSYPDRYCLKNGFLHLSVCLSGCSATFFNDLQMGAGWPSRPSLPSLVRPSKVGRCSHPIFEAEVIAVQSSPWVFKRHRNQRCCCCAHPCHHRPYHCPDIAVPLIVILSLLEASVLLYLVISIFFFPGN